MAVEKLIDRGIAEAPKLNYAPIENYGPKKTLELLKMYWNNRSLVESEDVIPLDMSIDNARIVGVMEIQSTVLQMLGQGWQIGEKRPNEFIINEYLGKIDSRQLESLTLKYIDQRVESVVKGVTKKTFPNVTPKEAKMLGKISELRNVLTELGQGRTINEIDEGIEPHRNEIDWAKMRSSGRGELQ